MAEITTSNSGMGKGLPKRKQHSTRVDLTPMVDLGFLLITFFVFTTSMSEPKAMKIMTPMDADEMIVPQSTTLTIIPIDKHRIFYYHGAPSEAMISGSFGITGYSLDKGIGAIIRAKQSEIEKAGKKRTDMLLVIKPSDLATFGNTVDILDEVLINAVTRYALTDLSEGEKQLLALKGIK